MLNNTPLSNANEDRTGYTRAGYLGQSDTVIDYTVVSAHLARGDGGAGRAVHEVGEGVDGAHPGPTEHYLQKLTIQINCPNGIPREQCTTVAL